MAGATARAVPHYPCQYIGMFRWKSYRDLKAHSVWFYVCTWYNYILNFFLTLQSILKLICELHLSLSQFLCHVLHVANFLLSCCQSITNMTLPFFPLLPAPRTQCTTGKERFRWGWFGCVCQCVCSMEVTLSNRTVLYFSLQVTDRQGIAHAISLRDW